VTRRRIRAIAWLSLVATLFSAVSPAIAGVLLAEQPRALARMLGIPVAEPAPSHTAHHAHDHGVPEPAQAPHSNHGIYCSFCLHASSTLAVTGAAAPGAFAAPETGPLVVESRPVVITAFHPFFRSRAPPH
jgi:hypothetical protein